MPIALSFMLLLAVDQSPVPERWPGGVNLAGSGVAPPVNGNVILQFWASWCHSCLGLAADIRQLNGPNVRHIAVSLDEDRADALGKAAALLANSRADTWVVHDAQGEWKSSFDVHGVPTILLLQNGVVTMRIAGHADAESWRALAAILSGEVP